MVYRPSTPFLIAWLASATVLSGVATGPAQAARVRRPAVSAEAQAAAAERPKALQGTVVYVLDGDTLVLRPRFAPQEAQTTTGSASTAANAPRPLRIRLAGIDAPELCQRGGGEARQALASLVAGQQVSVAMQTTDRYARIVGRVTVGAEDVGARLVAQGLAWSGDGGPRKGPYATLEASARAQHRGVFADADAQRPRDFRASHGACPHAPGSRIKRLNEGERG